jgi:hypothetical protein
MTFRTLMVAVLLSSPSEIFALDAFPDWLPASEINGEYVCQTQNPTTLPPVVDFYVNTISLSIDAASMTYKVAKVTTFKSTGAEAYRRERAGTMVIKTETSSREKLLRFGDEELFFSGTQLCYQDCSVNAGCKKL